MVRGAVVLRRDGMINWTLNLTELLVLLIIISPGPPPEAPLLLIAPQMRLLGFLSTYFGAVWLIVPGECHGNGLLKSQGT